MTYKTNHSEPVVQVLDPDVLTLSRCDWVEGELTLGLEPSEENPHVFTTILVSDIAARVWEVTGVPGVSLDVSSRSFTIRVPLVKGLLHLGIGSY